MGYGIRLVHVLAMGALAMGALTLGATGAARAQSKPSREIILGGNSGAHPVLLHPAYVTVLHFPAPVGNALLSDQNHFIVQIKDHRVVVRPSPGAKPGIAANLHVFADDIQVAVILHIVREPDQAVSQVVFRRPEPVPQAPPLRERLSLAVAGIAGMTFVGTDERSTVGDKTSSSLLLGAEARMIMASSEHVSYEAALAVAQLSTEYMQIGAERTTELLSITTAYVLTRMRLGISVYLGERVTPRLHLGGGMQTRHAVATRVALIGDQHAVWEGDDVPSRLDLIMTAGAGVDVAIHGSWRAGLGIQSTRAMAARGASYLSIEAAAFVRWL